MGLICRKRFPPLVLYSFSDPRCSYLSVHGQRSKDDSGGLRMTGFEAVGQLTIKFEITQLAVLVSSLICELEQLVNG